jgi:hypothetical protein
MSTITIPLPLPQLNDVTRATKRHWAAYAKLKADTTEAVKVLARVQNMTVVRGRYHVRCNWYPPNRRVDGDNLAHAIKYILDGVVAARRVEGDNYKWVSGIQHEFHPPDKSNPRVIVELTEVKA